MRLLATFAAGAALCTALLCAFWHWFGVFGLVCAMPVLGVLGKPLVDLAASLPRLAKRIALRDVEGRYFEFRGRSMDIHIEADARCWVSTADARKIAALPADPVLARLAPLECGELGDPPRWRITTEGLGAVLAKSSDPDVTKFRDWLEKEVARPARNRRIGKRIPD